MPITFFVVFLFISVTRLAWIIDLVGERYTTMLDTECHPRCGDVRGSDDWRPMLGGAYGASGSWSSEPRLTGDVVTPQAGLLHGDVAADGTKV